MQENFKMYILINQDLKIDKVRLANQVGSAVALYFHKAYKNNDEGQIELIDKFMKSQDKALLEVPKIFLEALESKHISVRDRKLIGIDPNSLICVNLGILDENNIPKEYEFIKGLRAFS